MTTPQKTFEELRDAEAHKSVKRYEEAQKKYTVMIERHFSGFCYGADWARKLTIEEYNQKTDLSYKRFIEEFVHRSHLTAAEAKIAELESVLKHNEDTLLAVARDRDALKAKVIEQQETIEQLTRVKNA